MDIESQNKLLELLHESDSEKKIKINRKKVIPFLDDTIRLLLIDYLSKSYNDNDVRQLFYKVKSEVLDLFTISGSASVDTDTDSFMDELPKLRELLIGSAKAIFDGDPASDSIQEIVLSYPGFHAITYYRIAHEFYLRGQPFLARLISEEAHMLYGIDINPGAVIGKNFFIDHGTGIVIGETAIIGDNVKLYQGVTLGALSLKKGHLLKGSKRHPTVEDDVTIYSNASIFGGDTILGKGSTIGANTYLIKSIPSNSRVSLNDQGMTITKTKE